MSSLLDIERQLLALEYKEAFQEDRVNVLSFGSDGAIIEHKGIGFISSSSHTWEMPIHHGAVFLRLPQRALLDRRKHQSIRQIYVRVEHLEELRRIRVDLARLVGYSPETLHTLSQACWANLYRDVAHYVREPVYKGPPADSD